MVCPITIKVDRPDIDLENSARPGIQLLVGIATLNPVLLSSELISILLVSVSDIEDNASLHNIL